MSRSAFALAALSTVAIPGIVPGAARLLDSTTDVDAAEIVDEEHNRWVIKAPRSAMSGAALEAEVEVLRALGKAVDGGALSFDVPRPKGFAPLPEGGRAMIYPLIPGDPLNIARLSAIASEIAGVLGALHSLPTNLLEETGLPAYTAAEHRERRDNELEEAAGTGHVPASLLDRWQDALADDRLWEFTPAIVHGDLAPEHILIRDARVAAVTEWARAHVGDPAEDLAPLLASAPEESMDLLLEFYAQERDADDSFLLSRAVLASELALVRWLMHGVHSADRGVIADAVGMLNELSYATEGTVSIAELSIEPEPEDPRPSNEPFLMEGDDMPTEEISRRDLQF